MRILQTKDGKYYLDQTRIISATSNLKDAIPCQERLSYATMRRYFVVLDSYEEAHESLMGSFAAFIRFWESYAEPTKIVWLNTDHGVECLEEKYGKNQRFLGKVNKQEYRQIKEAVKELNTRCLVIQKDWFIRFRDHLIMSCC